jgi:hypothetical protein
LQKRGKDKILFCICQEVGKNIFQHKDYRLGHYGYSDYLCSCDRLNILVFFRTTGENTLADFKAGSEKALNNKTKKQ